MNKNPWNDFDPKMFQEQMQDLGDFLESTTKRVRTAWNETQNEIAGKGKIVEMKQAAKPKDKKAFNGKKLHIKTNRILSSIFGVIFSVAGASGVAMTIERLVVLGGFVTASMLMSVLGNFLMAVLYCVIAGFSFSRARLCSRAQQYLEFLKGKTSSNVQHLSAFTGVSERQVKKDLRKLNRAKLIECVLFSPDGNEVFSNIEQYDRYHKRLEQKKEKEKQQQQLQQKEKEFSSQSDSHAFLLEMHQLNQTIEDAEVSKKVDKICEICANIFEQAKSMKETTAGFKKFESYYLPTTIKLLRVYTQVDDQPVDGVNIETIRRDIPSILDTLIQAYQNLLDSLYADVAMDISSEIAVLKDMLTQEGLVENEFSIK